MEKIKQRYIIIGLTVYNFVMIRISASVFAFPVKVLTDSDICIVQVVVIRTNHIYFHD